MKTWLVAFSVLALAAAAPATAFQAERDEGVRRAEQSREDGVSPGGRCISRAIDIGAAESFCEERLQCSAKAPPARVRCKGGSARYVCQCRPTR